MKRELPPLGSGERFARLGQQLERQGKLEGEAKRIAASIGRAKYGDAKMNAMARKGKQN